MYSAGAVSSSAGARPCADTQQGFQFQLVCKLMQGAFILPARMSVCRPKKAPIIPLLGGLIIVNPIRHLNQIRKNYKSWTAVLQVQLSR